MLVRAVTYPVRVTLHVMFAVANYYLAVPETIDLLAWPDDEPDTMDRPRTGAAPHPPVQRATAEQPVVPVGE